MKRLTDYIKRHFVYCLFSFTIISCLIIIVASPISKNDVNNIHSSEQIFKVINKKNFDGWSLITVREQNSLSHWVVPINRGKNINIGDDFNGKLYISDFKDESDSTLEVVKTQYDMGKINILEEIKNAEKSADSETDELKKLMEQPINPKPVVSPSK